MIVVPENKIVIIPEGDRYIESINQIVEPFKGNKKEIGSPNTLIFVYHW